MTRHERPIYRVLGGFHPAEDPAFPIWQECEPDLRRFSSTTELREHLRWSSGRREPDAALSAFCRLVVVERWSLPADVLAEAFSDELCRVLDGAELWRQTPRTDLLTIAECCLEAVAHESVLAGEEQSGRLLMSRTWAASFRALQDRPGSALLAEAEALCARSALAAQSWWRALRGRHPVDRILCRLHPLTESLRVADDASRTAADFERLCAERGIPARVARRQVHECRVVARSRQLELRHLALSSRDAHARATLDEAEDDGAFDDAALEDFDESDFFDEFASGDPEAEEPRW